MNKVFLLSYNPSAIGGKPAMIGLLNSSIAIKNWFSILEGAILLVSDKNEDFITDIIRARFPNTFFICCEIDAAKSNGWLPKANWEFIRDKVALR